MKSVIPVLLSFLFVTGLHAKEKEIEVMAKARDGICTLTIVENGDVRKISFPLDSLDMMKDLGGHFDIMRKMDVHHESTWLGVQVQTLTPQLRDYFQVEGFEGGVLVSEVVEDSPADKAGLKAGDVIIYVDREEIEDTEDLVEEIREKDDGEEVTISLVRDGRKEKVKATLETRSWAPSRKMSFFKKEFRDYLPSDLHGEMERMKEEMETLRDEMEELRERLEMDG